MSSLLTLAIVVAVALLVASWLWMRSRRLDSKPLSSVAEGPVPERPAAPAAEHAILEAIELSLKGEHPSSEEALKAMERAAGAGSVDAEFLCGVLRLYGRGLAAMEGDKAEAHFRRASDLGSLDAMYELALSLEASDAPKEEFIEMYLRGAQRGHLRCINGLRAQYRDSQAHRPEFTRWTAQAAALGDAEAQYTLGVLYASGDGVQQDMRTAVEWYRRAADQDFPEACHNLGVFHATGQGVEKDLAVAADWYRRAGELGSSKSCKTLAAMHYHGQGVPRDRAKAEEWMAKAETLANAERAKAAGDRRDLPSLESQRKEMAREWLRTIRARHVAQTTGPTRSEVATPSEEPRDPPRLTGGMKVAFELSKKAAETMTEWEEDENGVVRGDKSIPAPGLGMFGLITLLATLTPTGQGYECEITANCLPISQRVKETAPTLDEAKLKTEKVWASQVGAMALVLLKSAGA